MVFPSISENILSPGDDGRAQARYEWLCARTTWTVESDDRGFIVTGRITGIGSNIGQAFPRQIFEMIGASALAYDLEQLQLRLWSDAVEDGLVPSIKKEALDKLARDFPRSLVTGATTPTWPTAPQWTREPPTKPGWYWARERGLPGALLVKWSSQAWYDPHRGMLNPLPAGHFDLWCGPIEAPPLPEGA